MTSPVITAWLQSMQVVTLAESERAAVEAFEIPYRDDGDGESFMAGHRVTTLVARKRLAQRWPELTVALIDDGRTVARGVTIPFCSAPADRDAFPDGGWEQIVLWAAADALDDREPDTLCALEIAVHPDVQGRGLSPLVLEGMRENAARQGFDRLIAPVRPPLKAREPWIPMADYLARVRSDGLPVDPWLRVHLRAGGQVRAIASCSATISAPLDQWRRWTGMPLETDGLVAVPGGLVPLMVSTELDVGCYVEPNVWVEHAVKAVTR